MDDLQLICLFVNIHGYQCSTVYTGCRKPMLIYIYIYIHIYLHIIIYIYTYNYKLYMCKSNDYSVILSGSGYLCAN